MLVSRKNLFKYLIIILILFILGSTGIYAASLLSIDAEYKKYSGSKQAIINTYDSLLNSFNNGNALKNESNICGVLAWGESYVLQSLLEMYQATGNEKYLDIFIDHTDKVLANRSDRLGEKDWSGKLKKGWLTGNEFTLGLPIILKDKNNNPSIEIQAIRFAYNNLTEINISPDGKDKFRIVVKNPHEPKSPKTYSGLDMNNVENLINNDNIGQNALIRVKKLGTDQPVLTNIQNPETAKIVLHGHHTVVILAPVARFVYLVKSSKNLQKYINKAGQYQSDIKESLADFENTWVDKGTYGYYTIEKGTPFWCDGIEEPYNVMSEAGRVFMYLYLANNDENYKQRAQKIANLIKKAFKKEKNGSYIWSYWYGNPYKGWKKEANLSKYLSSYPPNKLPEDTSHAQHTILFVSEAFRHKLFFTDSDIKALINTFWRNVNLDNQIKPFLTTTVDGKGKGDYDEIHYGFLSLSQYDKSIWKRLLWVNVALNNYNSEVVDKEGRNKSVILLDWASLARYY